MGALVPGSLPQPSAASQKPVPRELHGDAPAAVRLGLYPAHHPAHRDARRWPRKARRAVKADDAEQPHPYIEVPPHSQIAAPTAEVIEHGVDLGWGLKCTNSALKALDLFGPVPFRPRLQDWAADVLAQATEGGA